MKTLHTLFILHVLQERLEGELSQSRKEYSKLSQLLEV